jgi:hypothetical protein
MKAVLVATLLALPVPAAADFAPVTSREEFLSIIEGRELRLGLFSIRLNVKPDGTILGSAMGWDVSGTWAWQDGYFCREMDWSGSPIPYNCQLVEVRDDKMRFTVDKGAGDEATFNLR